MLITAPLRGTTAGEPTPLPKGQSATSGPLVGTPKHFAIAQVSHGARFALNLRSHFIKNENEDSTQNAQVIKAFTIPCTSYMSINLYFVFPHQLRITGNLSMLWHVRPVSWTSKPELP